MGFPYLTVQTSVITTSTAATSAGNVIGAGVLSVTVPHQGIIQGVTIATKSAGITSQIDVLTFTSSMQNTTFTNNSAIAISSQDVGSVGPVLSVTSWSSGGSNCSIGSLTGAAAMYSGGLGGSNKLYFTLVARSSLTFGSTNDLYVTFNIVS